MGLGFLSSFLINVCQQLTSTKADFDQEFGALTSPLEKPSPLILVVQAALHHTINGHQTPTHPSLLAAHLLVLGYLSPPPTPKGTGSEAAQAPLCHADGILQHPSPCSRSRRQRGGNIPPWKGLEVSRHLQAPCLPDAPRQLRRLPARV